MKSQIHSERKENTLHISTVLKESWKLLVARPFLWVFLALIVNVVSFIEILFIFDVAVDYIYRRFGVDIKESFSQILEQHDETEKGTTYLLEAYSNLINIILLQLIVARIVFRMLSNHGKQLTLRDILSSVQHNLPINLLRTIGISVLYLLIIVFIIVITLALFAIFSFSINWLLQKDYISEQSIPTDFDTFIITILMMIMVVIYLISRWSLAESVMVNENKGIFSSYSRSWELTSSCRFKIVLLIIVISLVIEIFDSGKLYYLMTTYNMEPDQILSELTLSDLTEFDRVLVYFHEMIKNLVTAMIISVCYHSLWSSHKLIT